MQVQCVLALAASFSLAVPAGAVPFTVNSTADAPDATPGDGLCATPAGDCTLRAALMEANALPGADEVQLPAGSYLLSIPGTSEDAGATGDLDIGDDLLVEGAGQASTVIDGAGISEAVVHVLGPDKLVEIRNVSIQGGTGGILNAGILTVSSSHIRNNSGGLIAAGGGGGVGNLGDLTLIESTISDNDATFGGAIANYNVAVVLRSTLSGNSVAALGGAMMNYEGSVVIENSTLSGNTASGGGLLGAGAAIWSLGGLTTVLNSTITQNSAPPEGVGGVLGFTFGGVTLKNSIVTHNPGGDCGVSGAIASLGHNIDTDDSCALTSTGDLPSTDPLLGPLQFNIGPTFTHRPSTNPSSPAIGAADESACPPTDQRGTFRQPPCDIGSVETVGCF